MDECKIFCGMYETWLSEGNLIYEGDHAAAILSVTPVFPGQAIIFPKRHITGLRALWSEELESFMHAIPGTFQSIQDIYDRDVERIASFYESLAANPLFERAGNLAEEMLKHPDLRVKPTGYNTGMNTGETAGQLEDHLHWHLFPARDKRPGVVTAMGALKNI